MDGIYVALKLRSKMEKGEKITILRAKLTFHHIYKTKCMKTKNKSKALYHQLLFIKDNLTYIRIKLL